MSLTDVLVLTQRGLCPIDSVVVGDQVFTHASRWRAVLATQAADGVPVVRMAGGGHRSLVMSEDQVMLVRRNRRPQGKVDLQPSSWLVPAGDPEAETCWYAGSPSSLPELAPPVGRAGQAATLTVMGAYVADGWVRSSPYTGRRLGFSLSDDAADMPRLQEMLAAVGLTGHVVNCDQGRARRLDVTCGELAALAADHFGRGSSAKRLPVWLLGASREGREAFLQAYLAGDGCWDAAKGRWTASTASKELAIGLRLLGQSLGYACGYSWVDPRMTHVMGKPLKSRPRRSHRVTFCGSLRNASRAEGMAWQKVRTITPAGTARTFDLTVDEDGSYVADGLVCHSDSGVWT